MIELARGNLLDSGAEALVNPVNCRGVMGAGLALAFKRRFPEVFDAYRAACESGELRLGQMHAVQVVGGQWILHVPTKDHWRQPSKLEYVRDGLGNVLACVRCHRIGSIAIPALGCGLGGLDWADVEPLIRQAFEPLPEVRVMLYPPRSS
jgi:O-acetyl-ADP-ribose deacetylase (regulator of RNase III)